MLKRKKKHKKYLLMFCIGFMLFLSIGGYFWYNYSYNPYLNFVEISSSKLYDTMANLCTVKLYAANKQNNRRAKYLCKCFSDKLADEVFSERIRKKDFQIKENLVWKECEEDTKYSNMLYSELREMFENECIKSTQLRYEHYCECYATNMALIIKDEYEYESDIISDFDIISSKALSMCRDYLKSNFLKTYTNSNRF